MRTNLFLFTLIFTIKTVYIRAHLFPNDPVLFILVEFVTFLLIFSLIEIIKYVNSKWTYFAIDLLLSFFYMTVLLYEDYYGSIVTYKALFQAGQVLEIKASILDLLNPVYLLLFIDIPALILFAFFKKYPFTNMYWKKRYLALAAVASIAFLLLNGVAQQVGDIVNEKKIAQNVGIANYEVYVLLKENQSQILHSMNPEKLTNEKIRKLKGLKKVKDPKWFGAAKDKNIIIVQLEAFQQFPINRTIDGIEVTPNLNRLSADGIYFSHFYQQIGKGNTADAEFITNTSIYPVGDEAMSQKLGDKKIPSLPKLLKQFDYITATFHTNDVQFWNRDELYAALGFDQYFDKSFFGEDDSIAFGASDEVLYEKALSKMKEWHDRNEKFYVNLISMSSHHPFQIPEEKKKIKLPAEYEQTGVGDYLTAVNYADYSIGQLVEGLKAADMWEDTLLVIYGDHFGYQQKVDKDPQLMKQFLGRPYNHNVDKMNIPFIITMPWLETAIEKDNTGGQIDIMPTLLNLLGIPTKDQLLFGQDLLNHDHNELGERFYLPTGSFINEKMLFVPGERFEDGKATNLESMQPVDLTEEQQRQFNHVLELLETSDAYIETFPDR